MMEYPGGRGEEMGKKENKQKKKVVERLDTEKNSFNSVG